MASIGSNMGLLRRSTFVTLYKKARDPRPDLIGIWQGNYSSGTLTSEQLFLYGMNGKKLGKYEPVITYGGIRGNIPQSIVFNQDYPSTTNAYFGGKLIQQGNATFTPDQLGSNGKYFPYGEERNSPPLAPDQVKFATYTRDGATGLDYADQRYYASSFGRFMTPDPYMASGEPGDPQSWNRYAYVGDDPITWYDPQGLFKRKPGAPGAPAPDPEPPSPLDPRKPFCADAAGVDGIGCGDSGGGGGGGDSREASVKVGYDSLDWLGKNHLLCQNFLDALAQQGGAKTVNGISYSGSGIQAMARAVASGNYLYDGTVSSTLLTTALGLPANGTGQTVANYFHNEPGVSGLSQVDGLAIWVKPDALATVNGNISADTLGLVLEEVLHKFFGADLHDKAAVAAQAVWGTPDWQNKVAQYCFR